MKRHLGQCHYRNQHDHNVGTEDLRWVDLFG